MAKAARVLVTGASGFVAGHVIKQLQEAGHAVRGTLRGAVLRAQSDTDKDKVRQLQGLCPGCVCDHCPGDAARPRLELVEADLLDAESWTKAVQGMDYVLHLATPVPYGSAKNEDDMVIPAVQGTLNVLKASARAGTVKRVVLTSSYVAVAYHPTCDNSPKTEADWSDVTRLRGYPKSKALAEKAAWNFVQTLPDKENLELTVVVPSLILGPPLTNTSSASVQFIQKLLNKEFPALARLNVSVVDVRDVARAHVRAMTLPEAAGHRHIVSSCNMWVSDIVSVLNSEFQPLGYDVPTRICPNWVVLLAGLFDRTAQDLYPQLDVVHLLDNTRMREVLKIEPRDVRDTIIDMGHALINKGFVQKTDKYRGPSKDKCQCFEGQP